MSLRLGPDDSSPSDRGPCAPCQAKAGTFPDSPHETQCGKGVIGQRRQVSDQGVTGPHCMPSRCSLLCLGTRDGKPLERFA